MNKFSTLLLSIIILLGCNGRNNKPQPPTTSLDTAISTKPIYKVYIENSASMNGYVNGVTEFKIAVYNYLSDIKIADLTDSLNLNYINSKEIPYGSDIEDFIEKLNPSTFGASGGNKGTTDIADVLTMVLKKTSNEDVCILISDFIFSPGKGKDAEQHLINQQISIKNNMAEHLKLFPNHAVVIYQLESKFDGTYFNKLDNPSHFVGNRPYYIWIIGERDLLSNLTRKCPIEKFKGGGVKNIFSITKEGLPLKYAIQFGSGNFKLDKKDPHKSIINAQKDTKGVGEKKLRFNINVDLSDMLLDDSYLTERENYDVSDKDYQLEIQKHNSTADGYSHTLKLTTSIVKPSIVTIKLKSQVHAWVDEINDDNGMNLTGTAVNKTYGFKYLVYGIYEAFTKDGNCCAKMEVKINQK